MSDMEVYEAAPVPARLFEGSPAEIVREATQVAKVLAAVIRKQQLTTKIQGRDHVRVEGWTLLGTMLGVFPVCEWTRKTEDGWEARVVARTMAGQIVGAAEASCSRSERTWATRDDYALRSMAATRATSKALRQPLGFVMTLAGFEATPAEEMPTTAVPAPATPPVVESESAKDLSKVLVDLTAVDPEKHWGALANKWAQREYGKDAFALDGAELERCAQAFRDHLTSITNQAREVSGGDGGTGGAADADGGSQFKAPAGTVA